MLTVEVLYFAGCPAYRRARNQVLAAIQGSGVEAQLKMVLVRNERDAKDLAFHGSPTVRIGGCDIDPAGLERSPDIGLYSRAYAWKKGACDAPPEAMVREALLAAARKGPA